MAAELRALFSEAQIEQLEREARRRGQTLEQVAAELLDREVESRTRPRTRSVVTPLGRAKKPGKRD